LKVRRAGMDAASLRAAFAASLIVSAATLVVSSAALDGLRGLSIDIPTSLAWRLFGNAHSPGDSAAVVVAIDEETFRTPPFEGTPSVTWTPEIAQVLSAIIEGGAKVVGLRVVFPTSIEQSAAPFGNETLGARVHGFDRDYLRALALGARAGKVVLGEVQHQDRPLLPSPGQRAAVGFGRNIRSLNVLTDSDGVIRRLPLSFEVDEEKVPSMAAELAARSIGPLSEAVSPRPAQQAPDVLTLKFQGGADGIPTYSLADLHACVAKDDKDFFKRHFSGKIVLIGVLLDVEDRQITSKRFATAPEGARAERCALAPVAGQKFTRGSIAGVYIHATGVNNLLRGDGLIEFGRIGIAICSFALAALVAAGACLRARRGSSGERRSRHRLGRGRDRGLPACTDAAPRRTSHRRYRGAGRNHRLPLCDRGQRQAALAPELRALSGAGGHRKNAVVQQAAGARRRNAQRHRLFLRHCRVLLARREHPAG